MTARSTTGIPVTSAYAIRAAGIVPVPHHTGVRIQDSDFPAGFLAESREPARDSSGHGGQQTVQTAYYAVSDCTISAGRPADG